MFCLTGFGVLSCLFLGPHPAQAQGFYPTTLRIIPDRDCRTKQGVEPGSALQKEKCSRRSRLIRKLVNVPLALKLHREGNWQKLFATY